MATNLVTKYATKKCGILNFIQAPSVVRKVGQIWLSSRLETYQKFSNLHQTFQRRVHLSWKEEHLKVGKSSHFHNPHRKSLKRHSVVQTPAMLRKAPKIRTYQNDEMEEFATKDAIKRFEDLKKSDAPSEYSSHRTEDYILHYHIAFCAIPAFPLVKGAIKIDKTLCVQLQFQGCDVPLPQWFVNGRNGKLTSFSMLHNLPAYLQGFAANRNTILEKNDE